MHLKIRPSHALACLCPILLEDRNDKIKIGNKNNNYISGGAMLLTDILKTVLDIE